MNTNPHAARAMGAATASLLAFGVCLYMLITTANAPDGPAVPLVVFLSLGIAVSVILHLVFVGLAAARSGRRPWLWVVLALVGFPVTAIVGLVLMAYFDEERAALPATR
jgi:hypothetical protein